MTTRMRSRQTASRDLDELLEQAVDRGVVSAEQAGQLAALAQEAGGAQPPARAGTGTPTASGHRGPAPVVVEVLGYLGGALALGAGVFVAQELWTDLGPWVRAGVLAAVAVVTAVAGALLRGAHDAIGRFASFLWVLAVPAVGGATAVVADEVAEAPETTVALATFGAATLVASGLWALRRSSLQQIAAFVGLAATGSAALLQMDESFDQYVGYWLWALGLVWLLLAAREVVVPARAGWVLGTIAFVLGPTFTGEDIGAGSAVLGLASAAALVAVAVRQRRVEIVVIGVLGLLQHVPRLLLAVFEGGLAAPVVVLVAGIALVATSVVLARRSLRPGGGGQDRRGGG